MAYPLGFTYVSGPVRYVTSTVSSTATFKARNPLALGLGYTCIEATSVSTAIFGIACNDAANSLPGQAGKVLVEIPMPETVYACQVQTGVATSATSIGLVYAIEKSGNYLRIDTDSKTTPHLVLVGDEFGNTVNSADSSCYVRFLANSLQIFSSSASVAWYA